MNTNLELDSTQEAAPQSATLRGLPGEGGTYILGIVKDADVNPDQTFTMFNGLTFPDYDTAIASLQAVLVHAQQVKQQADLLQAYQKGVADANADVNPETSEEPMSTGD